MIDSNNCNKNYFAKKFLVSLKLNSNNICYTYVRSLEISLSVCANRISITEIDPRIEIREKDRGKRGDKIDIPRTLEVRRCCNSRYENRKDVTVPGCCAI